MTKDSSSDRLTIITTRTGDDGTTGLADGSRVPKTHARVVALGTVDELNSAVGLLLAQMCAEQPELDEMAPLIETLIAVQHALFDLGSELAWPGHLQMQDEQLAELETQIEVLNSELPPLREFVLPGGDLLAAQAHVARSLCRRAERDVIAAAHVDVLDGNPAKYLNRLSDYLFVLARRLNLIRNHSDIFWKR